MKKELRLLLVFVMFFCSVESTEPDWFNLPMVVPATQKEGHNYIIPVDVFNNTEIYKQIAVAAMNDEILFGEYVPSEGCAVFYSPRAGRRICHNRFFLLHRDYVRFYRRYAHDVYRNNNFTYCENKVEFKLKGGDGKEHTFQPFFDKPGNRKNPTVQLEKFIGTYFVDRDTASYWDHVERKAVDLEDVAKRQANEENYRDQYEVLCRMKISYREPNKAPDAIRIRN